MSQPADFNRLARLYRWMELFSFGPLLALTRRTFLGRLKHVRRALVLGDGDGRFTAGLLRANGNVHVDAVDASVDMLLALLGRAGPHADRVRICLGDARAWQPPAAVAAPPYDFIATHFFLDCLTTQEIQSLTASLRGAVSPSALWVVSEFAIPPGWRGRFLARPIVASLYFCFRLLTGLTVRSLPDHALALRQAGFILLDRRSRLGGLLNAELWSANSSQSALTPTHQTT
ncbi:MAG TPA: class I SAM-dependent methyltransferase [Terracidiphilus sp.]|jgi:SAM-dependent methyltransferase|nr:class I SAM-dependent methyltransferase [Terracidiphilus sp.]